MNRILVVICLSLQLCSCNGDNSTSSKNELPENNKNDTVKTQGRVYIKDGSIYDKVFINGLQDYNDSLKIIDNYVVAGQDTIRFPESLPLNKEVVFKGSRGKVLFELNVKRIGMTALMYSFTRTDKETKAPLLKEGKAIIGSMFFLASEVDEDDLTGTAYGSTEYWEKQGNCWTSIRIDLDKDDNGKQRAIISFACEDNKEMSENFKDCPTLRTE